MGITARNLISSHLHILNNLEQMDGRPEFSTMWLWPSAFTMSSEFRRLLRNPFVQFRRFPVSALIVCRNCQLWLTCLYDYFAATIQATGDSGTRSVDNNEIDLGHWLKFRGSVIQSICCPRRQHQWHTPHLVHKITNLLFLLPTTS